MTRIREDESDSDIEFLGSIPPPSTSASPSPAKKARKSRWSDPLRTEEGVRPLQAGDKDVPCTITFYKRVQLDCGTVQVDDGVEVSIAGINQIEKGLVRRLLEVRFHAPAYTVKRYAHIHWLRNSVVGDTNELFFNHGQCQDVPLRSVCGKLELNFAPKALGSSTKFARYVYEPHHNTWRLPHPNCECDSCHSRSLMTAQSRATQIEGGFGIGYTLYHKYDIVFLDPEVSGQPWLIGQIYEMRSIGDQGQLRSNVIRVRMFGRVSDLPGRSEYTFTKRLYLTNTYKTWSLSLVRGKCTVRDSAPDRFLQTSLKFYCNEQSLGESSSSSASTATSSLLQRKKPLRQCELCKSVADLARTDRSHFRKNVVKFPAIDLYAGGGGSVTGAVDFLDVRHAVEFETCAANTLARNHPKTVVHCAPMEDLHARELGKDNICDKAVPHLPRPGSMFLMTAGPPCQGHSGLNQHQRLDDPRNAQLFITIDELDRLQADILVVENVAGFKRDRADVEVNGEGDELEGTKNFAVAAIKRLLARGYQCRLALLDSRAYGSPQSRVRLFILAARGTLPLPHFPHPTHANPSVRATIFSVEPGEDITSFYTGEGTPGCGPLPAVTAEEAISDLPSFEYEIPGVRQRSIPHFSPIRQSSTTVVGYTNPTAYRTTPANDFQAIKRGGHNTVKDHWTPPRSPRELAIIVQAHNEPYAGERGSDIPGSARRLDPSGQVYTLLTTSAPGSKGTGYIHWNQLRTFSIAERKRFTGLPDGYRLCGTVAEQDRQLGNAIVVEMAAAIYQQITDEVIFPWWLRNRLKGYTLGEGTILSPDLLLQGHCNERID